MKGKRPVPNFFSSSSDRARIVRQGPPLLTRGTNADSEAHLVLQDQFELLCDKYSIGQPAKDSIIRLVARYNSGGGAEEFLVEFAGEHSKNVPPTYKSKPFYAELIKLLPNRSPFPKVKFMQEVTGILRAHKDKFHLMPEDYLNGFKR